MTSYRFIGTGTTDASGVARLTKNPQGQTISGYVGTSSGEIDFVASLDNPIVDGSLVSVPYSVLDCLIYDDGHTGQASGRWWNWNTYPVTKVRSPNGADYTSITSVNARGYACFNFKGLGVDKIIFDVYKTGGSKSDVLFQLRDDNVGTVCSYSLASFTNLELDTWYTVEMNLIDGTVTINNQVLTYTPNNETQFFLSAYASSETRFRDLRILNHLTDKLIVDASNNVIQSTDTTDITGKLYVGGILMLNTDIDVYKNGNKVGTINTGSTGTASYTYTGDGSGKYGFHFKYGNVVSKVITITDAQFVDSGAYATKNNNWTTSNITAKCGERDTYTTLSNSSSSNGDYTISATVDYITPFVIEFDNHLTSDNKDYIFLLGSSNTIFTFSSRDITGNCHVKLIVDENVRVFVDGVEKNSVTLTSAPTGFRFRVQSGGANIGYSNFVIYSI